MGSRLESPRRRHILSSINPDEPRKRARTRSPDYLTQREASRHHATPSNSSNHPSQQDPNEIKSNHDGKQRQYDGEQVQGQNDNDKTQPRSSRLRLKSHKSRRRSRERHRNEDDGEHDMHRHSRRRRHRHRSRHRSPTPPNPHDPPPLDPDAAFRESLFDAMADDEGASYWEGVYGQPVHIYSNERSGPTGMLEQMTDEEYAAHVRQKMWEKTHAGLMEERARREEARKRKHEKERLARKLQEDMERSLRRGEERRRKKQLEQRWEEYTSAWSTWDGTPAKLPWPVESFRREDVNEQAVRAFLIQSIDLETVGEKEFLSQLKDERVRWHPDKIQQKLGGQVDDEIMKGVTAVFQIIDRLWSDSRSKT